MLNVFKLLCVLCVASLQAADDMHPVLPVGQPALVRNGEVLDPQSLVRLIFASASGEFRDADIARDRTAVIVLALGGDASGVLMVPGSQAPAVETLWDLDPHGLCIDEQDTIWVLGRPLNGGPSLFRYQLGKTPELPGALRELTRVAGYLPEKRPIPDNHEIASIPFAVRDVSCSHSRIGVLALGHGDERVWVELNRRDGSEAFRLPLNNSSPHYLLLAGDDRLFGQAPEANGNGGTLLEFDREQTVWQNKGPVKPGRVLAGSDARGLLLLEPNNPNAGLQLLTEPALSAGR